MAAPLVTGMQQYFRNLASQRRRFADDGGVGEVLHPAEEITFAIDEHPDWECDERIGDICGCSYLADAYAMFVDAAGDFDSQIRLLK